VHLETKPQELGNTEKSEIHKFIEQNEALILQQGSGYITFENDNPRLYRSPPMGGWASRAPMPTPRISLAIGVVNNKIYAIGGHGWEVPDCLNVTEEYDPITNTWTTKGE
jgi:hypothetical protein